MPEMSERKFAERVEASRAAVQERRKAGLLPSARQDGKGRWLYPDACELEWHASMPLRQPPGDAESLEAWRVARARKETAQATLAELEVGRAKGELILASQVEARMVAVFSNCKTKLLALPSRARQQLPHLSAADVDVLDGIVRETLEALAGGAA
ncbi:MAG TPA: hypothetical protein VGK67_31550 [Myxococcales bacterium]|jgi:phage terminase Nu1 subunit (DNA packaging protein)